MVGIAVNEKLPIYRRIPGYAVAIWRMITQMAAGVGRAFLRRAFSALEALMGMGAKRLRYAPVFIIGPPRSGSTLLYQLLVERFQFGFLSNWHSRYFFGPAVAELLFRPLESRRPLDYVSNYGEVAGDWAPSECGHFWYRFFRRQPMYVPGTAVNQKSMRRMRTAVNALVRAFNRPVLFKNMNCALRLEPLCANLPEAVFIVTSRDEEANAQSIINARRKLYGSEDVWYSLEPPDVEELKKLAPSDQARQQVRSIHCLIRKDIEVLGAGKFLEVSYADVCAEPEAVMMRIKKFLSGHGIYVADRGNVPEKFDYADGG